MEKMHLLKMKQIQEKFDASVKDKERVIQNLNDKIVQFTQDREEDERPTQELSSDDNLVELGATGVNSAMSVDSPTNELESRLTALKIDKTNKVSHSRSMNDENNNATSTASGLYHSSSSDLASSPPKHNGGASRDSREVTHHFNVSVQDVFSSSCRTQSRAELLYANAS